MDLEILLEATKFRVVRKYQVDSSGRQHAREIVEHPGAVAIIPRLDDGRICLIENQRAAVGKTLLELPAGTLEPGEHPAETARRELAEETGYRAGMIEQLSAFYTSPGILDERMYLFLATQLEEGTMGLEAGEVIEPRPTEPEKIMEWIRSGAIEDGKTLVGLLWYFTLLSRQSYPN